MELDDKAKSSSSSSSSSSPQHNPLILLSDDDDDGGDHFSVDELLDFSNHNHDHDHDYDFVQLSAQKQDPKPSVSPHTSILPPLPSFPSTGLTLSAEELANIEWLSHFVEDSFSGFSAPFPIHEISFSKEAAEPCFKAPVPVKPRTKRTRTGGRVWCLASPSFTDSPSNSTSSSSSSSPATPCFILSDRFQPDDFLFNKPNRKPPFHKLRTVPGFQPLRRCSHCGVQKTPQWRTGPLGPKTLCNACGVRFKSGRLLPEYRPACSPTFSTEFHSNHHRKVIEMRRKKETTAPAEF